MLTHLVRSWIGVLAAAMLGGAPAAAVTLSFAPAHASGSPGDTIAIDVVVSDLGTEIVSAFDLDVLYDPSVLTATAVSFGSFLGDAGLFEVFESASLATAGVVDFSAVSLLADAALGALQTAPFTLATLSFTLGAGGISPLAFGLAPPNEVIGRLAQPLQVSAGQGSAAVVPEPGAALAFTIGFGVVAWAVRRSRCRI
jgi:hypothetical protein